MAIHDSIRSVIIGMIVSAIIVACAPANAGELSARELYEFCNSKDQVASTACRFFILGAVLGVGLGDGAVMGPDRKLRERARTHFCIPENVSQSTMVSVFQKTIGLLATTSPDDLKSPSVSMVFPLMPSANQHAPITSADPRIFLAIAVVAALIFLAVRSNRNDKHPAISAFAWTSAVTMFVWTVLVWLTAK
jgi:hypothetical protein